VSATNNAVFHWKNSPKVAKSLIQAEHLTKIQRWCG